MLRPDGLEEDIVHEIVGLVLMALDLFQDDVLFPAQLLRVDHRVAEHVGEDVDRIRNILRKHFGVVAGVLLVGEGIQIAADPVDLVGDLLGAAPLGPLEEHVLDHMRDSPKLVFLIARPDPDPNTDRCGLDIIDVFGDNPNTIIEHFTLYHKPSSREAQSAFSAAHRAALRLFPGKNIVSPYYTP